jgi:CDP-diacylglycerol--serine O-phosphatidyltransferase
MIVSVVLMINAVHELKPAFVYALPVLMLLISFLMVSTIRYPSFKQIDWHTRARLRTFLGVLIIAAAIFFFKQFALVLLFLAYLLFGIGRHVMSSTRRRAAAHHAAPPPPPSE